MAMLSTSLCNCGGSSSGSCCSIKPAVFSQLAPYPKKQLLEFGLNSRFFLPQDKCRRNCVAATDKHKHNIHSSHGEATEPARLFLEKLFAQTQKLEEKMSKDLGHIDLDISLEKLESDLNDVLSVLRRKEEDLELAEQILVLDRAALNRAKRDLDRREEEVVAAQAKKKVTEEDMAKVANHLTSRAREVESLKAQVKEHARKIADLQSSLTHREQEHNRLRRELSLKSDEVSRMRSEIVSKNKMLNEANGIMREQRAEIDALRREVTEKEQNLYIQIHLRKGEQERLSVAEANLKTRTLEWVAVGEELKNLAEQAASNNVKETDDNFERVSTLLSHVRSELVASRESLSFCRTKFESQSIQIEKQFKEIKEQKLLVTSYKNSLKDAQLEVENERTKLRMVEAQNDQLELQLSSQKELVVALRQELNMDKASLRQATEVIDSLRQDVHTKQLECLDAQNLLQIKETELKESRRLICNLTSEKAHLKTILEEKDRELVSTQKLLSSVNCEILEYKTILKRKEYQLVQSNARMQENEDFVLVMQSELDNTRLKFSEAATLMQRIVQLTDKVVVSIEKNNTASRQFDMENPSHEIGVAISELQKQLPTVMKTTTALLNINGIEYDELDVVLKSPKNNEKEIDKLNAVLIESNTNKLSTLQFEVEAATVALSKVVHMSSQLLNQGQDNADSVSGVTSESRRNKEETSDISIVCTDSDFARLEHAKKQVAHLLTLTQRFLEDAGSQMM